MKKLPLIILGLFLFVSSCSNEEYQPSARHVIVIGIDGMSPEGVRMANTPHMDYMMENGSYTMTARAVLGTSSGPNWASILMGAGPEQHGVTSNSWRKDQFVLPTMVSGSGAFFPTIFKIIEDQKPEMETGTIYDWSGIKHLFDPSNVDYEVNGADEVETTDLAIKYFKEKAPHFMFVHLDHVDGAGHGLGYASPAYYRSVSKADSLIGRIKNAVEEVGMLDETVFIITSDHGGIGYGHGGETPEEIVIPWISYGKGIRKNHKIKATINTFDTPATAAYLLDIEIPYSWIGRPVKHAMEGVKAQKVMYYPGDTFRKAIISPTNDGYSPAGGLFIEQEAEMSIRNPNSTGIIRYTLDGTIPSKNSEEYIDPIKITETTIVNAVIFNDGIAVSQVETAYFRILKKSDAHGVNYKAYEIDEMEMLPDFSKHKPSKSGTAFEISIDYLELVRQEHIAMEFEGFIQIDEPGTYTFTAASDDGSKLYINGKEIVDNDGDHGVILKDGSIELESGLHEIRVTWFNGGGGKWLGAMYQGPGVPMQIIPPDKLYLSR